MSVVAPVCAVVPTPLVLAELTLVAPLAIPTVNWSAAFARLDTVFLRFSVGAAATVVDAVLELLVVGVLPSVTVAVFVTTVPIPAPGLRTWVYTSVSVAPAARPLVQVIVLPLRVHGPAAPVWVPATGVFAVPPPGKLSVITSGFAVVLSGPSMSPGPLLVTAMVQVTVPLGLTVGDPTVFVTERS